VYADVEMKLTDIISNEMQAAPQLVIRASKNRRTADATGDAGIVSSVYSVPLSGWARFLLHGTVSSSSQSTFECLLFSRLSGQRASRSSGKILSSEASDTTALDLAELELDNAELDLDNAELEVDDGEGEQDNVELKLDDVKLEI
jgi:hypothetical protein